MKAIAQLLVRFNFTWVGLVRGDHEYGRFAVQGLLRELQGTKVCVAYQEIIPMLYNRQRTLEILQVHARFYRIRELLSHKDNFIVNSLHRECLRYLFHNNRLTTQLEKFGSKNILRMLHSLF